MLESNRIVQSLWIGGKLSPNEILCVRSYIENGHQFHLYTYEDIPNVPDGTILRDANDIMSEDQLFTAHGSYSTFSDMFRYKMLYKKGGWWSDMDAVCVRPYDYEEEYVFMQEKARRGEDKKIVGGVIKCPPYSGIMKDLIQEAESTDYMKLPRGSIGPRMFHRYITNSPLAQFVVPPVVFCPIGFYEINKLFSQFDLSEETKSVHLYNEMWRLNLISKYATYRKDSLYEKLKRRSGVKNSYSEWLRDEMRNGWVAKRMRKKASKLLHRVSKSSAR